jgi:holliday junction DNA helicase RuvA
MIAKLRGRVDTKGSDNVIVDVGGVGYLVACSRRTLDRMPPAGGEVELLIETIVREDAIQLFGFADALERDWFRLLTTVQGVGPRIGNAILSTLAPDELARAIATGDKVMLARPNGVGPRLAQRLAVELKDRMGVLAHVGAAEASVGIEVAVPASESEDAVSALVNLGYRRAEAELAVASAARRSAGARSVEMLVRAGLRELAR